jgi:transcriptional regulator
VTGVSPVPAPRMSPDRTEVYIPEYNRVEDRALTLAFMRANPFAILISTTDEGPFATHLPILARQVDGCLHLRGHVAKANPHWKSLESGESLLIFHSPHAYISPTLYENRESVPTWNYAAVHVYGTAKLVTADGKLNELLWALISQLDSAYLAQWSSLTDEYRSRMIRHIVGFEIQATRVETKFKLSQNRSKNDQESVIQALAQSPDSTATEVARLMRQLGLGSR